MKADMKNLLRLVTVSLLVLCFVFAVGCGKKDKKPVVDPSENQMPTLPSSVEDVEEGSDVIGQDNADDVNDLLNPDNYDDKQNSEESKPSSNNSTTSSSESTPSSNDSSKPVSDNNQMATESEKNTGDYDTPGWIL